MHCDKYVCCFSQLRVRSVLLCWLETEEFLMLLLNSLPSIYLCWIMFINNFQLNICPYWKCEKEISLTGHYIRNNSSNWWLIHVCCHTTFDECLSMRKKIILFQFRFELLVWCASNSMVLENCFILSDQKDLIFISLEKVMCSTCASCARSATATFGIKCQITGLLLIISVTANILTAQWRWWHIIGAHAGL